MRDSCKVCEQPSDLRMSVCFDCANFESLIADKVDMHDRPIKKTIEGSEALNILKRILEHYGRQRRRYD